MWTIVDIEQEGVDLSRGKVRENVGDVAGDDRHPFVIERPGRHVRELAPDEPFDRAHFFDHDDAGVAPSHIEHAANGHPEPKPGDHDDPRTSVRHLTRRRVRHLTRRRGELAEGALGFERGARKEDHITRKELDDAVALAQNESPGSVFNRANALVHRRVFTTGACAVARQRAPSGDSLMARKRRADRVGSHGTRVDGNRRMRLLPSLAVVSLALALFVSASRALAAPPDTEAAAGADAAEGTEATDATEVTDTTEAAGQEDLEDERMADGDIDAEDRVAMHARHSGESTDVHDESWISLVGLRRALASGKNDLGAMVIVGLALDRIAAGPVHAVAGVAPPHGGNAATSVAPPELTGDFPPSLARDCVTAARARSSALLPETRLRAMRLWDGANRTSTLATTDGTNYYDAVGANLVLEARLTWRLDRVLYASDEPTLERIRLERQGARARVASRVLEALFAWERAAVEARGAAPDSRERIEAELRRSEAHATLDVLTGGWFSASRSP
jgi:hypothetical protein